MLWITKKVLKWSYTTLTLHRGGSHTTARVLGVLGLVIIGALGIHSHPSTLLYHISTSLSNALRYTRLWQLT